MDNKKDTLSYLVAKIKREAEYGEQAEACRKAGVTYHVLQKAMKRKKLVDLTTGELKAVNALVEIIDERKALVNKLKEYEEVN